MTDQVAYFTFQTKTAFFPLKFIYPECFLHIKDSPKLFPMKCFVENACPPNANCGEILVRRVHFLFDKVIPDAEMLIAYFKYHDKPNSLRGAIFNRDLDPPMLSTLNPFAFEKFRRGGKTYQWQPPSEYLLMGGSKGLLLPAAEGPITLGKKP